ncbi:Dabb family protein [Arenibacter latericius]|uniref:Dabb family protein n=1 Tax=Arenibacter latericius TaxID=86104 RepID=UPI000407C113|nr:Dabb family protein [Arenibacter latericius]
MKTIITLSSFLISILLMSFSHPTTSNNAEAKEIMSIEKQDSLLRHVVLFKFKEETSPEDIAKVEVAFSELPNKIPQIKGYEWGLNNSPEGLNKGLTHCFFLTFSSEEDRDIYLPHPDHKAFGAIITPHLDDVVVVDYWAK